MNILLVDDKYDVIQGIKEGVDWNSIGDITLFSACSGENAIKIIENNRIQLLITDIEMPGMSGLELAEKVKERENNIGIIVLTSYDSFRYAQTAVRLGCYDYILQPVEYEKLQNSIIRVINHILTKEAGRKAGDSAAYQKSSIQKERAWKEVIIRTPAYEPGVMRDILEDANVFPKTEGSYRMILISLFWRKQKLDDWVTHRSEDELFKQMRKDLYVQLPLVASFTVSFGQWVLILDNCDAVASLEQFFRKRAANPESAVAVYISEETFFSDLPKVYQCLNQLNLDNVGKYEGVFEYHKTAEKLRSEPVIYDALGVQKWTDWILDGNENQIREKITVFLEEKDRERKLDKQTLVIIAQMIISTLYNLEAHNTEKMMVETEIQNSYARATDSVLELLTFLDKVIERCREKTDRQDMVCGKALLNQIKNYVGRHLDSALSREEISSKFFISKDYLSRIFTKNEGMGFTQYVNERRISKAKELLRSTNLPIKIISLNVGIADYAYFSKMFRQSVGVSANEYRAQNQKKG